MDWISGIILGLLIMIVPGILHHFERKYRSLKDQATHFANAVFIAQRTDTKILRGHERGNYYVIYKSPDFDCCVCCFFEKEKEQQKKLSSLHRSPHYVLIDQGYWFDSFMEKEHTEVVNINPANLYCDYE